MGASLNTVDGVLKNFYIGPLQKQISDEVRVLEMFEKATVTWSGKKCVIAVHTKRNDGVFWTGDGGNFKAHGNQTVAELNVRAKYLYGRFEVTGPTIASAKGGNARSFIGSLNLEMGELVKDVRNQADKASITGGIVKGFTCERVKSATTLDVQDDAAPGIAADVARDTFIYDGDFSVFEEVDQLDDTTWVPVNLRRMDNYELVTTDDGAGGAATNPNWWVTAADSGAGTVDIWFGTDDAAGAFYTTADVQVDRAIAIELKLVQNVDGAGDPIGTWPTNPLEEFLQPVDPNLEVTGVFTNLASSVHFGLDRTSTDPDGVGPETNHPALQTLIATQDTTNPGGRLVMTLPRLGRVEDEIYLRSGEYPDCLMISPLQRNRYQALLQGHITKDASGAPKADGGFKLGDMSHAGIDLKSFRQVPNGVIILINKMSWMIAELQKGEFADMDGRALSRTDRDAYEGYYAWYWELVCQKPFCNAILCGLTL